MAIDTGGAENEKLFPEITIDYETTVLTPLQQKKIMEGALEKSDVDVFAYSVQIGLLWQSVEETKAGKFKTKNRFEAHIFLDARVRLERGDYGDVIIHRVIGDVVAEAIDWLEELFLKQPKKTRRTDAAVNISANAFNAAFEESYTVYSLLSNGYVSDKVIPRGLGGVMISQFHRMKPYENRKGEVKEKRINFKLKETAGQWAAGTTLSQIFKMYGLGAKTETPLLNFAVGKFFDEQGYIAKIGKEFISYAAKDVIGLFQALLKKRAENGQPRTMTASSTTRLNHEMEFKKKNGIEAYEYFFKPASSRLDAWLRPLTLGGYNFVERTLTNQYMDNTTGFVKFLGIDRTNAYLSVMCENVFPIGTGIKYLGQYEPDEEYPFYFQKVQINSCQLKKGYMPSLQVKHGTAEDVYAIIDTTREDDKIFILNQEELELFFESYQNIEIRYIDGYKFQTATGDFLFGEYLRDKFYRRKEIKNKITALQEMLKNSGASREIDEEIRQLTAQADTLKLWGNGLYGKMFENQNKKQGMWFFDDDGFLQYEEEDVELKKGSPSHIGSQILRRQRCALIKACNKVIKAGGIIMQCDTDAFLCALSADVYNIYQDDYMYQHQLTMGDVCEKMTARKLSEIAGIEYGDDLGQWHLEKSAVEGITVEKKVYFWSSVHLTPEQRNMTIAQLFGVGKKGDKIYVEGQLKGQCFVGTRGVRKLDAKLQLTPNTWRRGQPVLTTQFARLAKARKAQIKIKKVLAI